MQKQFFKSAVFLAAMLCLGLLGGCSTVQFKSPEEQPALAAKNSDTDAQEESLDLKVKSLEYEDQLVLPSGAVAAVYHAELPQFEETGSKKVILKKINEYYEEELKALQQDCESYFNQIRSAYGATWETSAVAVADYRVDFTYRMVESTSDKISFVRSYVYNDVNMKQKQVFSAETFDCSTGWPLKLSEMFGNEVAKVNKTMEEQIGKWCEANTVDRKTLEAFDLTSKEYSFALSRDTLYLCLDEKGVSGSTPGARLVEIPTTAIESLLRVKTSK
ncbi:hypothetical protein [Acidaminobacterium chupaoyuni]